MTRSLRIVLVLVCVLAWRAAPAARQAPLPPASSLSLDEVVDRFIAREAALATGMAAYHPRVEVYIQHLAPNPTVGAVPTRDDYFLGQFTAAEGGPAASPLSAGRGWFRPSGLVNRPFGFDYVPSGFAAMTVPDRRPLDRTRYDFSFVRREFLDEVRTLVFDVRPKADDRDGFTGRFWVEDRDFTIVRFNGISRELDGWLRGFFRTRLSFHVDSWRINAREKEWLPAYVYFEETDFNERRSAAPEIPKLRGQVRLWGYEQTGPAGQTAFTVIQIGGAVDNSEPARQVSPILSQRRWETQAENNILDRLLAAGLLAPPGPVDAVLETVLNNLQVTNEVVFDPPLKARVLLTSALESFMVGRTVIVSRGLIDVLPDEASLAMVLGHELAHVALGHLLIDTKFAFADRLMIPDADVIPTLRFFHTQEQETEADARLLQLLGQSPYQDKLATAGLFLRAVTAQAKALPNLVQPHFGDYIRSQEESLMPLIAKSPALEPGRIDQIAALPLGARVMIDPWSSRLDLNRAPAVPLYSAREKLEFAITPLFPYLQYAE